MKKSESHVSSEKNGRKRKTNAPNARGSRKSFDPEVEEWFGSEGVTFSSSQSSIIPMLQSAQATLGYLPRDAMQAIARHLCVSPAQVEGVASFYSQFRFNKPGINRVTVCTGTACYVRGSGKLIEDIQTDLNVQSGETTPDGVVSLESVSCFGACALAPVVVLNDKVLRQQTSVSIKTIIKEISSAPSKDTTGGESNK